MLLESYDKDIKWILSERANHNNFFGQRGLTIINFFSFFEDVASKLEKNGNILQVSIHLSLLSVATDDRKQVQYLQIVFNEKNRPLLLEFN